MFTIIDPRALQRDAPYTFYLPSEAALAHVAPGDSIKLIFEPTGAADPCDPERMWVEVTARDGDALTGKLDNKPFELSGLALGDTLHFAPHQIIAIDWSNPDEAPDDPDPTEQWLARCLVERAVVEGRARVGYMWREVPETPEASPYPDTGWCLRPHEADIGTEEYEAEDVVYVAIGAVLNVDDSFVDLLYAPPGSAFARQNDGQFAPVPYPEDAADD